MVDRIWYVLLHDRAMSGDHYSNRPELKDFRQRLRNGSTPAERALWQALKGRSVDGLKFRRQHSVGRFVLDFYCPAERVAIELDGGIHTDPLRAAYDAERQAALEAMGITVLRLPNAVVLEEPARVSDAIAALIHERRTAGTPPPDPESTFGAPPLRPPSWTGGVGGGRSARHAASDRGNPSE